MPELLSRRALVTQALQGAGHGGSIVDIASIPGLRGASGDAASAVSMVGPIQLKKALAPACGRHDIRVWARCPAYAALPNTGSFATQPGAEPIKHIRPRRLARVGKLKASLPLRCPEADG